MPDKKIQEFKSAIEKYNTNFVYNKLWVLIACSVVCLQFLTVRAFLLSAVNVNLVELFYYLLIFIVSYVLTDFINGLVHMYMDNNTSYASIFGPLIAAFHLHHKQPVYKNRSAYKIYFYESGAKVWLPFYLLGVFYLQYQELLPLLANLCLVSVGVLSSFAEVSHYWCHNSKSQHPIVNKLQQYRILLSKDHHKFHHINDNKNYAFLNGVTDPVINIIARWLYTGYKNNADIHAQSYTGTLSSNRS